MDLRIPANQVPFVRKFFQHLDTLAENTAPGRPLIIERELLSSLSDTQLEGFKRLVNYYSHLDNNARTIAADENSELLLNFYRKKNRNPHKIKSIETFVDENNLPIDVILKRIQNKTNEELESMPEQIEYICEKLKKLDFGFPQESLPDLFKISHILADYADLIFALTVLDPEEAETLGKVCQSLVGKKPLTNQEANEWTHVTLFLCNKDVSKIAKLLKITPQLKTYLDLKEATELSENNLRHMTDYLQFGKNTSNERAKYNYNNNNNVSNNNTVGGKRKTRRIKKH